MAVPKNRNTDNLPASVLYPVQKEGIQTEPVHIGDKPVLVEYVEFVAGTKPFMFHHW